jgi:hypothetical protein
MKISLILIKFTRIIVKCILHYLIGMRAKNVRHQISVSFEKFDIIQALLSFFLTLTLFHLTV